MRIFVHESVTAGDLGTNVPDSLRREGAAMRDAVCADLRRIPDVIVNVSREPGHDPFQNTAAGCDWTLVIAPEFDGHLRRLSQCVLDVGGHLLGSLPSGIAQAADKLATARVWQESDVPHPHTDLVTSNVPDGPAPWVIKPRHGAGSQAVYVVRDPADWLSAGAMARLECRHDDLICQPFVPGHAASVALLVSPHQVIPLMPARQRLSGDDRLRYLGGTLPLPGTLGERARRIALQAIAPIHGLCGYVGVDVVLGDDGVDHAIEINPRLTTSYLGLRQLCDQNIAELMLRCAEVQAIEPPTWRPDSVTFEV